MFWFLVCVLAGALGHGCEEEGNNERPPPPPGHEGNPSPGTAGKPAAPKGTEEGTAASDKPQPEKARPPQVQLPPHARPRTVAPPSQVACAVAAPLRLVQELRFDEPKNPQVRIVTPEPNAVIKRAARLTLTVELTAFKTWKNERAGGNRLRVVLDDRPPQDWYDVAKPYVIDGLPAGRHSVRVFLVTALGEAVKTPGAFAATSFYIKTDKDMPLPVNFSLPALSYNAPEGTHADMAGHRVMLDFHLSNAKLAPSGYSVLMTLDDRAPVRIRSWSPVWLEGLKSGEHSVTLELRGPNDAPVQAPFTKASGKFVVQRQR